MVRTKTASSPKQARGKKKVAAENKAASTTFLAFLCEAVGVSF